MAENTKSHDIRRLEESLKESWKESLKDIMARMQMQDDNISSLNLQHTHLMTQLQRD